VVVAVAAVRVVKVPRDEVVHVISMRHGRVPALCRVDVVGGVPRAAMRRRARGRVRRADLEHVLVDMIVVAVMEMTIVQVVDVVAVTDRDMAAIGSVNVVVVRMGVVAHGLFPSG